MDRDAFAENSRFEQQMNLLMSKIMRAARGGNSDAAMKLIDEAMASADSDQLKQQLMQIRISVLMQSGKSAEALTALDEMIESQKNPACEGADEDGARSDRATRSEEPEAA